MNLIKQFLYSGNQRSIAYKRNTINLFLLKGLSLLISLLYVPLLLNSLDTENYAIWLTLTSIVSWISMLDIGLGNGLRNKLAEAMANGDEILARKYISSAYGALSIVIVLFLTVFLSFALNFMSWNSILNAPNIPTNELNELVAIVFISFGLNFILNLLNSILLALQKPALSSFVSTIGQLASLVGVIICVNVFNNTSLITLGAIISLMPVVVLLFASIILFAGSYKHIAPNFRYFDKSLVKNILSLGLYFFIIQIMTIFIYQSNNIIITHSVGNEAVVEYNIASKYMFILYTLYMIIVTPLWSATTQAYVTKDHSWIKDINHKLNRIIVLFFLVGIIMLCISPIVFKIWLNNDNVCISHVTTSLLLISEIFRMFYANYGYIINGIGKLHAQLVISIILGVVYIPLAIFAGQTWGLKGVLIMNIIVNICNALWSKYQFSLLINNRATGFWNK